MPPLDMLTHAASSLQSASEGRSVRSSAYRAPQHVKRIETEADAAGERRRSRALKLRQTRTRNAAKSQSTVYTSAEDSEEEVRSVHSRRCSVFVLLLYGYFVIFFLLVLGKEWRWVLSSFCFFHVYLVVERRPREVRRSQLACGLSVIYPRDVIFRLFQAGCSSAVQVLERLVCGSFPII